MNKQRTHNISYPQVRQQWFSVCIFPPRLLFGLTGNRPQSAPACSFLRYALLYCGRLQIFMTDMKSIGILILTVFLASCGQSQNKKNGQAPESTTNHLIQMAKKIKIDGLENALITLKNGKTEYNFIGITSNGIDCIYFVYENGKFNIEFEAMTDTQIPFLDKLKDFANSNNFKNLMTTYNNQPKYKSDKPAPVIRIETNVSVEQMTKLGERIQREIFKNNNETIYEVVP